MSKPPDFDNFRRQFSNGSKSEGENSRHEFSSKTFKNSSESLVNNRRIKYKRYSDGALISIFISNVEMTKVMGFDMIGSKEDLVKKIASMGDKGVI